MDHSITSSNVLPPILSKGNLQKVDENVVFIFDSTKLQKQPNFPEEFVWPDLENSSHEELNEPLIDMDGIFKGDEEAIAIAAELIRTACMKHGFFQITNHGIDPALIRAAYDEIDPIFMLPMDKKLSVRRKPGTGVVGYSGAHADRFMSKLPWKETYSFEYDASHLNPLSIVDYFKSVLGQEFEQTGWVYQKYCEAMKELSLVIMELLAISLGVDRLHYREFFEDQCSIMRCNFYPPCIYSGLTLGTGPHCDPTSLTILYQDEIGGLEVFADNKWQTVRPRPGALVINIGDTMMALSNGKYKSCLHRALVNQEKERKSLAFFVNPNEDKVVRPPQDLFSREEPRKYPDFTWPELLEFTQHHYRADEATLQELHLHGLCHPSHPTSSNFLDYLMGLLH
ncbi:Gibberellin 20-oxidase [Quillaja saponaria]|uniref:Gibberellin 20-oxidase n=1 Tax=Quillaja saponaria TaxID=32244 RepID=A0AAD7PJH8_QUISA|nr:Gibberellin 20-oxidase [Quillaja saponaria]